ncbi:hypothetical protein M501DRAFT_932939, partial [Patellaria atrata CBS 101060]
TTKVNLENRMGLIFLDDLPGTITDAILVTRKLSVRYLWVDAICIIQDDMDDWETQGSQMDTIFFNSWLTIAADCAEDSQSGFIRNRNTLSIVPCIHPSIFKNDKTRHDGNMVNGDVVCHFPASFPSSYLEDRGWIMQEELLSRRLLHYEEETVTWECPSAIPSERSPQMKSTPKNLDRYALQRIRFWYPRNVITALTRPLTVLQNYQLWHRLVKNYSNRHLSVPTDILPAIAGLANAWNLNSDTYIAGLWRADLIHSLAWHHVWYKPVTHIGCLDPALQHLPSFSSLCIGSNSVRTETDS